MSCDKVFNSKEEGQGCDSISRNMADAYQTFMLSKGKHTSPSKDLKSDSKITPNESIMSSKSPMSSQLKKKMNSKLLQIARTFAHVMKDKWIHADDQLFDVMTSIKNVRTRLPVESRMLAAFHQMHNDVNHSGIALSTRNNGSENDDYVIDWKGFGYRNARRHGGNNMITPTTQDDFQFGYLNRDDIYLAWSHDLLQHEKLASYVRKLLSNMNDAVNELGRRLNNAMMCCPMEDQDDLTASWEEDCNYPDTLRSAWGEEQLLVEAMIDIYAMSSKELYRKQCLANHVLSSMGGLVDALTAAGTGDRDDSILRSPANKSGSVDNSGVNAVAQCCKDWSRRSKKSCICSKTVVDFLKPFESYYSDLS